MDEHRLQRLYQAVALRDGDPRPMGQMKAICRACIDLLGVSGAGVMLMAERMHQGTAYATDDIIQRLEDLQNNAAEGPCLDAYNLGRPVFEPDLADGGIRAWPLLAPTARKAGMAAVFAFPLQLDDTSVGALDLYRDQPGPLTDVQIDDARLLAAMATRAVLGMQADAAPGTLPAQIADLSGDRAAIEQATGMVAAQLSITVAAAAARLRTAAREADRALAVVAHDIVARTLRLE
ncbi:MAG: GAF domain-containing protein [Egibacteraceae bacterium]